MAYIIAGVLIVVIGGAVVWWQSQSTPAPMDNEAVEMDTTPTPPEPPAATPTEAPIPDQTEIDPMVVPEVSDAGPAPTPSAPLAPANDSPYKDGSYTTQASYFTPRRTEHQMSITLVIDNGIVTDAAILYDNAAPVSSQHKNFDNAYREVVIGKPLDSLALSRVGGASLTTNSFNEAVAAIKVDAAS